MKLAMKMKSKSRSRSGEEHRYMASVYRCFSSWINSWAGGKNATVARAGRINDIQGRAGRNDQ